MSRRFLIFLSVYGLLVAYTAAKAAALAPGREGLACALAVLVCLAPLVWQLAYRAGLIEEDSSAALALGWGVSALMALWATFMAFSLAVDAGELLLRLLPKAAHPFWSEAAGRWMPAALFAGSVGAVVAGIAQALAGPRIQEVEVPVAGLAPQFDGLRIAQISDLHVGPTIRGGYVKDVARRVLELRPDLIAVTGDLADGTPAKLAPQLAPLGTLKAPLGVYYVTGNHEYYWDAKAWVAKAAALGFTPLVNENRVVDVGGAKLLVGGVCDTDAGHFIPEHASDPAKAAASGATAGFKLLLAHRPDSCEAAEPAGFDLQICGHTHGGQFFPFSLLIPLFHRYYKGLNRHGRMWVYVSTGTGYWGPPDRFLVRSEITLLRLKAA